MKKETPTPQDAKIVGGMGIKKLATLAVWVDGSAKHFGEACRAPPERRTDSNIFMYRGNTPFCSKDCRQEEIKFDKNKEKSGKVTSRRRKSDPNKNSTPNKNVRTGSVVVA
ncbi:hypothetical protein ACFX13_011299 [Malus domestica]